jgi:endonuclease/exonuclease/phosphatase family metal-dependent hydrolase
VLGTWNLEHFYPGAKRGFPESTRGGPSIAPRTSADHRFIADTIEAIDMKLVILQEIGAHEVDAVMRSEELDAVVAELGSTWSYRLGASGRKQHVGFLFDTAFVALDATCETAFDDVELNGKGVFDRQGFYGHATFLDDGARKNDLVVFGVHLASGQYHTDNHDHAMRAYASLIAEQRGSSPCVPAHEQDVLIAGDFNANRFDTRIEKFWDEMESDGWDVLGDSADVYQATRLSGVPLKQRNSLIDYIIVSQGLAGEEVTASTATVHADLLEETPPDAFRTHASDHLPVTVEVAVTADRDCCKLCSSGKPCGDSCIAATSSCSQPPGCACSAP